MAVERGILVSLMFTAVESKTTFNSFYSSARSHGLSYRRADMLADWHNIQDMVESRNAIQGLSSGEYPDLVEVSKSRWKWTEPFVYQARVVSQITKAALPETRMVTVLSGEPLTKGEIEAQISGKWPSWEYGKAERIVKIEPVAAIHWIGE
jgi:hypothetical protein